MLLVVILFHILDFMNLAFLAACLILCKFGPSSSYERQMENKFLWVAVKLITSGVLLCTVHFST